MDFSSKAEGKSLERIDAALAAASKDFRASKEVKWGAPLYQYANRLSHLYFLRALNGKDAYMVFLYFANAPDVPRPASVEQWKGAARLTEKCMGLGAHPYRDYLATVIWDVKEMIAVPA